MTTATRYHVSDDGVTRVCHATTKTCQYADSLHGATKEEAQARYEAHMAEQTVPSHAKTGNTDNAVEPDAVADNEGHFTLNAIPVGRRDALLKSVEKANRRLTRAGIDSQYTVTEEEFIHEEEDEESGLTHGETRYNMVVTAPVIRLSGYTFLASVSSEDGGLITRTAPGVEMNGWRPESMECQHCGKTRPRSKTYLVEDAKGDRHQIGSTCLAAYMNGIKPAGLWAMEDDITATAAPAGGYSHQKMYRNEDVVAITLAVSNDGQNFVSQATAQAYGRNPTSKYVNDVLHGGKDVDPAWRADMLAQAGKMMENGRVEQVIYNVRDMEGENDYVTNMKTLVTGEYVSPRSIGMLASAVGVEYRAKYAAEKVARAKAREEARKSEFVPGHFLTPEAKIPKGTGFDVFEVRQVPGHDGWGNEIIKHRVTMKDEAGHQVVWFASSLTDLKEGQQIRVSSGRVRKHGEYRDIDQTIVSNLRIMKN